jgi:hypothetical protein
MVTNSIKNVNVSAMALLLTTGNGLYGLKATDPASVKRMLDWVQGHSRVLVDLAFAGRLDESAIGMGAARDLGSTSNIDVMASTGVTLFEAPLIYYLVSSQLYQLDRNIGTLRYISTLHSYVAAPSLEPPLAKVYSMGYSFHTTVSLTAPEVNYG